MIVSVRGHALLPGQRPVLGAGCQVQGFSVLHRADGHQVTNQVWRRSCEEVSTSIFMRLLLMVRLAQWFERAG